MTIAVDSCKLFAQVHRGKKGRKKAKKRKEKHKSSDGEQEANTPDEV